MRDTTYVYYLFYVLNVALLQFTLMGFGFQFLWPDTQGLNNTMTMMFTALMPFSAILFVRKFLELNRNGTRVDIWIGRLLIVLFGSLLLLGGVLSYMVVLKIIHGVSMLAILFGFYLGVSFWLKGLRSAKPFALAWFTYLVLIGVYLLDIQGITQPNVISSHALEIGAIVELTLLSLAFGDKINEEKEKRLRAQAEALSAQAKLNRNLDGLVRTRTLELEEANKRLKELST